MGAVGAVVGASPSGSLPLGEGAPPVDEEEMLVAEDGVRRHLPAELVWVAHFSQEFLLLAGAQLNHPLRVLHLWR